MSNKGNLCLKLYVLNDGSGYREKLEQLRQALIKNGTPCDIEIIDLTLNPEQAEEKQILAIPTLIKEQPTPPLRLIGSIDDIDYVVSLLLAAH